MKSLESLRKIIYSTGKQTKLELNQLQDPTKTPLRESVLWLKLTLGIWTSPLWQRQNGKCRSNEAKGSSLNDWKPGSK